MKVAAWALPSCEVNFGWVASFQGWLVSYRHSAPRPTSRHQGSPTFCKEWLLFMSLKTCVLTVKSEGG